MDHLSRVTAQSARNKMNPQNLSICFAPVLMLDFSQGQPVANNISEPIQILKYLIEIWPKSQGGLWTVKNWLLISMEHLIVKTWIDETQLENNFYKCIIVPALKQVHWSTQPYDQFAWIWLVSTITWSIWIKFIGREQPTLLQYCDKFTWDLYDQELIVLLTWLESRSNTNHVFPLVLPVKKSVCFFTRMKNNWEWICNLQFQEKKRRHSDRAVSERRIQKAEL